MATFKLEIVKKFGKFNHRLYQAGAAKPDYAGDYPDPNTMIDKVMEAVEAGTDADDTVIFRGIGYENRGELKFAVREAPY